MKYWVLIGFLKQLQNLKEVHQFICESFQDYSWIQDFEAAESQPQNAELGRFLTASLIYFQSIFGQLTI